MKHYKSMDEYTYSREIYNGYKITSQYLTMRDGVKLAIDIYRPTLDGKVAEEPMPVIWCATQYRRRRILDDGSVTTLEANPFFAPGIDRVLYHGYVLAILDVRGSGASFGNRSLCNTTDAMEDFYEVNEWLAVQPFCNGKVGMCGCSYLGMAQWEAALMAPPHLVCVVPNVAPLEVPYLITNGVLNSGWMAHLDESTYDKNVLHPAIPVDDDPDGVMRDAAVEEHKKSPSSLTERYSAPYLDSILPFYNRRVYMEAYFPNFIHRLNNSSIAVYIWGGWGDFFSTDAFQWYNTLKTPKKLLIGPWYHTGSLTAKEPVWAVEHLRWFDYWLKGIDNGIMDEPPIQLYNCLAKEEYRELDADANAGGAFMVPDYYDYGEWRDYQQFPVPGTIQKKYYLHGGRVASVASVNDGNLIGYAPREDRARDAYVVDYTVSKDKFMDRNYYNTVRPRDFTPMDEHSLTYTTAPLKKDVDITGFPVAHLYVSTTAPDVDFYCYVSDVDELGRSHQISEGRIRPAIRALKEPPFENMGLPYHRNCEGDQQPVPVNEIFELEFSLSPLSNTVLAGHRIRITLNNCDKGNWNTPELDPAPTVCIYRDKEHPSHVVLPIVEHGEAL